MGVSDLVAGCDELYGGGRCGAVGVSKLVGGRDELNGGGRCGGPVEGEPVVAACLALSDRVRLGVGVGCI